MSMDSIVNTNVLTIYTPKLGNNGAAQSGILGGSPNVQTKGQHKRRTIRYYIDLQKNQKCTLLQKYPYEITSVLPHSFEVKASGECLLLGRNDLKLKISVDRHGLECIIPNEEATVAPPEGYLTVEVCYL